jgi:hypothetical protein
MRDRLNRIFILFDRRFRNRRAAASRQREQAAAAAAAAAAANTQNQNSAIQVHATSTNPLTPLANAGQTSISSGGYLSSTIKMPQQQQQQQSQLMKMQNMRLQQQSGGAFPTVQRQQTVIGNGGAINSGEQPQQEQSALDFAQSAAARVTATGSAAAAMAAAKFKMLRSNTLAAAFGKNETSSYEQSSPNITSGVSHDSKTTDEPSPSSAANLIAIRTKGERVNTVSSPSSRLSRFDFNS